MLNVTTAMKRHPLQTLTFLLIAAAVDARVARAADSADDIRERMSCAVTIDWSGVPLRQALHGLAKAQGFGVVLDRRVDPGQPIEFSARDIPLAHACAEIAEDRGLGTATLGSIVYFGPKPTARTLRTLAALGTQQAEKLPSTANEVFLSPKAWQWDKLVTPRELVEQLAQEAGAKVTNLDKLRYDLWAANELPPASLVDRLTLVLAQYGLTFRIEDGGKTIALIPIDSDVAIERSYAGGADAEALAGRWADRVPEATITVVDRTINVRGLIEDHEQLAGTTTVPRKSVPVTKGTRVHTLNVDDVPLGRLLDSLARAMDLELKLDRESIDKAGVSLDQLASLHVKDTPTLTLFKKLLNPLGLDVRINGNTLHVFAK